MNATPRAPSTALIRVLLVGDDPSDHRLVTDLLDSVSTRRFLIDWARTLADGLDRLRHRNIDICLLDVRLPDGDGLNLLASADTLGRMLPTIVLTDMPSHDEDRRALALGASAYLDKGMLDPATLDRTIRFAMHQRKIAAGLARQAFKDEATGLISAPLFRERLDRALAFARRRHHEVAVMMIDLAFDPKLPVDAGLIDTALAEAGRRLSRDLRETDSIARLSARRIGLVIEGLRSLNHAAAVARKVLRRLRTSIDLGGETIKLEPSLGVAIYPREGGDADALMRQAEGAMCRARDDGGGCRFGSERIDGEARAEMVLEKAFAIAFESRDLRLRFQPEVCLTGKSMGLAAVIVWRHPDRGWLPLDGGLADTDDEALIKGIVDWSLASAAEQLLVWDRDGVGKARLSLTVPFRRPPTLALLHGAVQDQVAPRKVAPERIGLDLQEGLVAVDARQGGAELMALEASGVRLALDGFGQGPAVMRGLRHDLLDGLKLTADLCLDLQADGRSRTLVQALVRFGHGLGLEVTAKGAGDQEQFAFLKRLGCDAVQLSAVRPMSAEAATAWLKTIAERPKLVDHGGRARRGRTTPEILVPGKPPLGRKTPPPITHD